MKGMVTQMEDKYIPALSCCRGKLSEKALAIEIVFQQAVAEAIERSRAEGYPVARYDAERKCPYLEYPNGYKEYNYE